MGCGLRSLPRMWNAHVHGMGMSMCVCHLGVEARIELPLAQAVEREVVRGHQPRHGRVVAPEQVGLLGLGLGLGLG